MLILKCHPVLLQGSLYAHLHTVSALEEDTFSVLISFTIIYITMA